jgi:hypothetical protein
MPNITISRPKGRSAAGRQIAKLNAFIRNRTSDITACTMVPQPTKLLRTPYKGMESTYLQDRWPDKA